MTNGNRVRKYISKLELEDGSIIEDKCIIESKIISFFANLYSSHGGDKPISVALLVYGMMI